LREWRGEDGGRRKIVPSAPLSSSSDASGSSTSDCSESSYLEGYQPKLRNRPSEQRSKGEQSMMRERRSKKQEACGSQLRAHSIAKGVE